MKAKLWILVFMVLCKQSNGAGYIDQSFFDYKKSGNDFTLYVYSFFNIGYGDGLDIGIVQYQKSTDTLFVKVFYQLPTAVPLVGSVSNDTLYYHNTFSGIKYLNISTNYYTSETYYPDPEKDTTRNLFDSTFNLEASKVVTPRQQNNCTIYPNPASDKIWIQSTAKAASYKVFDALGRLQLQEAFKPSFSVKELVPGYYFLLLYDEQNTLISKTTFIKQQ